MISTRLLCFLAVLSFIMHSPSTAQWVQTSGPQGAGVLAIVRLDTVLIAGTDAGLYRTTDNAERWRMASRDIYAEAFAVRGDTVFAGASSSVYRSTDAGQSWATVHTGTADPFLEIDALLAVNGSLFAADALEGLYRSTDDGSTWTTLLNPLQASRAYAITNVDSLLFAGTDGGVLRSSDRGVHWTAMTSGMTEPGGRPKEVRALAVTDSFLFAATWDGIFRSSDLGANWTPTSYRSQAHRLNVRNSTLFALDGVLLRSTDGGASWSSLSDGLPHLSFASLCVNGDTLWGGTELHGVYRSTDDGATWAEANTGMVGTTVRSLAVNKTTLFAGSDGSGLLRSEDGGSNWQAVIDSFAWSTVTCIAVSDSSIVLTNGGIFQSTDNGKTWTHLASGLMDSVTGSLAWFHEILFSGPNLYAAANKVVFRSTDGGQSWNQGRVMGSNYTLGPIALLGDILFASIAAEEKNGSEGILRSTDQGMAWSSTGWKTRVNAFVTHGPTLFAGTEYGWGVIFTSDSGRTWSSANTGLPPFSSVRSLCLVESTLFVSLEHDNGHGGVFFSTNDGRSWTKADSGLAGRAVWALAADNSTLYAGTFGAGVWKRPLSELMTSLAVINERSPEGFCLAQNWPNPFNPSTEIAYTVHRSQFTVHSTEVKLVVYDLLGREVAVLVNEKQAPGRYTVRFDGSRLASGVYFYRLTAECFVETKKLMILR